MANFVAHFFGTDFDLFCTDALFIKQIRPDFGRFGVFWYVEFGEAAAARYVQAFWIQADFANQVFKKPA